MTSGSTLLYSLIALALLVLVLIAMVLQLKHQVRMLAKDIATLHADAELTKQRVNSVKEQVHEVHAGTLGVGDRVGELTKKLRVTEHKQAQLEDQEPELRLYNKAARMAAQGANVDDIVQSCELPQAEAELLVNLHKK